MGISGRKWIRCAELLRQHVSTRQPKQRIEKGGINAIKIHEALCGHTNGRANNMYKAKQ
jgi:hypothetical protein